MTLSSLSRRATLVGLVVAAGLISAGAQAAGRVDLNQNDQGVMLHGYDPVAYFTAGAPAQGSPEFSAEYDGATYLFVSTSNRDAFLAQPAAYVPAYGGFCAMGTALEKKLDGDPQVWRIVDGRLYLNVNTDVQKRWSEDVPGNIAKADATWPQIRDVPADVLNAK
ncbi:MAG: YHS domain-containing (seleno)protein [Geminicoccaceae bacterium]